MNTAQVPYAKRRPGLIKEARRLRAKGYTFSHIGMRLGGFKRSTVCDWINHPTRHNPRGAST